MFLRQAAFGFLDDDVLSHVDLWGQSKRHLAHFEKAYNDAQSINKFSSDAKQPTGTSHGLLDGKTLSG